MRKSIIGYYDNFFIFAFTSYFLVVLVVDILITEQTQTRRAIFIFLWVTHGPAYLCVCLFYIHGTSNGLTNQIAKFLRRNMIALEASYALTGYVIVIIWLLVPDSGRAEPLFVTIGLSFALLEYLRRRYPLVDDFNEGSSSNEKVL